MSEPNEEPPDLEDALLRPGTRLTAPAVIRSGREVMSVELALTVFRQMLRGQVLGALAVGRLGHCGLGSACAAAAAASSGMAMPSANVARIGSRSTWLLGPM